MISLGLMFFFFSSRRRHTRYGRDWSSDVCSSDLHQLVRTGRRLPAGGTRGGSGRVAAVRRGGRSEERRVGEECRFRWSPDHLKKKKYEMLNKCKHGQEGTTMTWSLDFNERS